MQRRIRTCSAALATAVGLSVAALIAPQAAASPPGVPAPVGPWGSFYDPPSVLPGSAPGDVIREEPMSLALSVPSPTGAFPGSARRIMYRSVDDDGNPLAVTGTYFEPSTPWAGGGPRPLISLASGTIGEGRQCAPSIAMSSLLHYRPPLDLSIAYEQFAVDYLLTQGIAVVFTDYVGLGTPGPHPYGNRAASARAVIDAARAAQRLPGTSLDPSGPVGFWGYSQGGHAAGAAAELQPSYAPELNVAGTYAGAPPVKLDDTLARAEGSTLIGAVGYYLNGVVRTDPEIAPVLDRVLNDEGKAMVATTGDQCVAQTLLTYSFQRTSQWTTTGESLGAAVVGDPVGARVVADQALGNLTPGAPVLLAINVNDDAVPYERVHELAGIWRSRGVPVTLHTLTIPPILPGTAAGHGIPEFTHVPTAAAWMVDRFHGLPVPS
ncbi:MAG TPA: lipase family protein [Nocardia sp.]|uniref:lipase family protein n=1 Tax=Nocardia sp. TaxID=1821 RepID=UPI002B4B1D17|nr:lipase family protein [Nocardia sp.]HLS76754.1 lipase family protein [Nocardia sp.]